MIRSGLNSFLFITTILAVLFQVVSFSQGTKFIHVATDSNTTANWTVIDNPALNGNPEAIFFVTQNWNPGGVFNGVYNASAIGVWYADSKWAIFNQDINPMPLGAAFNVFIPSGGQSFVHSADSSNIIENLTEINNSALNGNPFAILFVTQNWDPSGVGDVFNNSEIGVLYDQHDRWAVFNANISNMPPGAAFNILLPSEPDKFIHVAADSNIMLNWTIIDNPNLNGNPNAIFFVIQTWNPEVVSDNSPIGVWYDGSHWAVFNENRAPMTPGTEFNIFLAQDVMTGTGSKNDLAVQNFSLEQNYPNPFNPSTKIRYSVAHASQVQVKVYDILGKEVETLVNEEKPAGSYELTFNAAHLPSGIYCYQIRAGSFVETKKMVLLR